MNNMIYGFLRETSEQAKNAGIDKVTGLPRTGLDEYLKIIYPDTVDWIHDRPLGNLPNGEFCRKRPDYRSESLKLIVEFDGLNHYTDPVVILRDKENVSFYNKLGYKVVRIPYFIQLSKFAVFELFGVEMSFELFNEEIPSLSVASKNTPAFLCAAGVERMKEEFKRFPKQFKINKKYLADVGDEYLTGVSLLF